MEPDFKVYGELEILKDLSINLKVMPFLYQKRAYINQCSNATIYQRSSSKKTNTYVNILLEENQTYPIIASRR